MQHRQFAFLFALLTLSFTPARGQEFCIRWDIAPEVRVNTRQAERLYREACRWMDQNLLPEKPRAKPCITVHVGRPCPDPEKKGACLSPVTGDIYIPKWDKLSAVMVAQGTITTALLRLLDPKEISIAAHRLWVEDNRTFFDYSSSFGQE
jgi:hypothetical protein